MRQGTSVQELVLDLTIAASHNNARYTCRVSQGTFIGERMIIVTGGKSFKFLLLPTFYQRLLLLTFICTSHATVKWNTLILNME